MSPGSRAVGWRIRAFLAIGRALGSRPLRRCGAARAPLLLPAALAVAAPAAEAGERRHEEREPCFLRAHGAESFTTSSRPRAGSHTHACRRSSAATQWAPSA